MTKAPEPIDISHMPQVLALALEAQRTGQSYLLTRGDEELAVLQPVPEGREGVDRGKAEDVEENRVRGEATSLARELVDEDGQLDPRLMPAIEELKARIRAKYPTATFRVGVRAEPAFHLYVTVDLEDDEELIDLVIDRVLELQVEEDIPLHVIPLRPHP